MIPSGSLENSEYPVILIPNQCQSRAWEKFLSRFKIFKGLDLGGVAPGRSSGKKENRVLAKQTNLL
jgi:hypothetical protein